MDQSLLLQTAVAAKTRYQSSIQRSDLDTAQNAYVAILAELPPDHVDIPAHKIALAEVLIMLGDFTGDIQHYQDAVKFAKEAVAATPPGDPLRPDRLTVLGIAYQEQWSRVRDKGTLLASFEPLDLALQLADSHHPQLAIILSARGQTSEHISEHEVGEVQLQHARDGVVYQQRAVEYLSDDDDERAAVLRNYAGALITFNALAPQEEQRLDDAVSLAHECVRLTDQHNYRRYRRWNICAMAHHQRWRFRGNAWIDDMHQALQCTLEAAQCVPREHRGWLMIRFNLSASKVERYEILGDLEELETAIQDLKTLIPYLPETHPHRSARLTYLGKAMFQSFRNRGLPSLLDEAIAFHEEAVERASPAEQWRYRQDLGEALLERYLHQRDPSALDAAVKAFEEALDGALPHQRFHVMANLAHALTTRYDSHRYDQQQSIEDLDRAIQYFEQVMAVDNQVFDVSQVSDGYGLALLARSREMVHVEGLMTAIRMFNKAITTAPESHPSLPKYYCHCGRAHLLVYYATGALTALEQSINALKTCLRFTLPGHPLSAHHQHQLAISLLHRFGITPYQTDLIEASALLKAASDDEHSFVMDRWTAARDRAKLLHDHFPLNPAALESYSTAISLLPRVAWLGLEDHIRYETAQQWISLGNDAAACAIMANQPERAIEFLENSRSVLWNQLYQLGQSHEQVREIAPELVDEMDSVGRALEANMRTIFQAPEKQERQAQEIEQAARARRRLAERWDHLMAKVRVLRGAENFLGWSTFQDLRGAGDRGPVIAINISRYRCDGIIITKSRPPHVFPLPAARMEVVEMWAKQFIVYLSGCKDPQGLFFADQEVSQILHMLWRDIGMPLCQQVQRFLTRGQQTRVWLMPTGALGSLPLHAAMANGHPRFGVQDVMIPSYTPTLSAMIRAQRQRKNGPFKMLAVGCPNSRGHKPLPCWPDEKATIHKHIPPQNITVIEGTSATVGHVLKNLPEHNFLHICCHGEHEWQNPYKSHLALWDGNLTLRSISHQRFELADFAFLSACHTARVDPRAPDEAVHLASGMNLAGFKSIIATMWGIADM
ncbi:hypothetical protein DACRYDRAFT_83077, partial [Dacryopinax primogenitus]